MRTLLAVLGWIFVGWFGQIGTPTPEPASIISPVPGAALQGQILIYGSTDLPGFQMSELWYSYKGGEGSFLISQQREPVRNGELGVWDTTTINDGNYDLHLKIFLADGSIYEVIVEGLRVRNSSPIETNTPEVNDPQVNVTPTNIIPTATVRPTATELPANPASIAGQDLENAAIQAGLVVVAAFLVLGMYSGIRKLTRRP